MFDTPSELRLADAFPNWELTFREGEIFSDHQPGVVRIRDCTHSSIRSRLNRQSLPTRKAGSWPFLSNL